MSLQTMNPATGETLATYEEMTPEEVRGVIGRVHEAQLQWRRTGFRSRAALTR